ncbi:MAG: hypothetical protein Fur0021_08020 [Candidatus Promineifilaceae bacterium]
MRVLIDTNLFIAYLLKSDDNTFIVLDLGKVQRVAIVNSGEFRQILRRDWNNY